MKYRSTQGSVSNISFEESLYTGWLDDRSLLVPEFVPKLSEEEMLLFSKMSYQEIIVQMFRLFADEDFISVGHLQGKFLI